MLLRMSEHRKMAQLDQQKNIIKIQLNEQIYKQHLIAQLVNKRDRLSPAKKLRTD